MEQPTFEGHVTPNEDKYHAGHLHRKFGGRSLKHRHKHNTPITLFGQRNTDNPHEHPRSRHAPCQKKGEVICPVKI